MKTIDVRMLPKEPIQGHTSKGDQPKWQHDDTWYKADYMGYETLSEVIISMLLAKSNAAEFVTYEPVMIESSRKTVGCASPNFRGKNEMLVPLERLHRAYRGMGLSAAIGKMESAAQRIQYTVQFVEEVTNLQHFGIWLTSLLELDAFFLNEDRHTNNIAVIRNEDTLEYRLCPIFDNGLSLLSDLNDYPIGCDIYEQMQRVQAKPFAREFDEQVFTAQELFGPQLKFTFNKKDVSDAVKAMADFYDLAILQRVEDILFEQMRKYRYLFYEAERV